MLLRPILRIYTIPQRMAYGALWSAHPESMLCQLLSQEQRSGPSEHGVAGPVPSLRGHEEPYARSRWVENISDISTE